MMDLITVLYTIRNATNQSAKLLRIDEYSIDRKVRDQLLSRLMAELLFVEEKSS